MKKLDKEMVKTVNEVIDCLQLCEVKGKKCKGCKEKYECQKFIRTTLAVCLNLIVNKPTKLGLYT